MYVILTRDVAGVGLKNSLVAVSKGYFSNFLAPQKLAHMATAEMIESMKDSLIAQSSAEAKAAVDALEAVGKLKKAVVHMSAKASDKGTLFKALLEKDVADAVKAQHGVKVDPEQLTMDHLKKVGKHAVQIQLGDQAVEIAVEVAAEADTE